MGEVINQSIRHHYKRTVIILMILMVVFAGIFLVSFVGLQKKQALLGIGMPVEFENSVGII
jgi:hypothetical protein